MSDNLKELTKEDWRKLGFYYDQDKKERHWHFVGSRDGLLKFATLLDKYCSKPKHAQISEHNHFGPYWYLKVVTMNECLIDENGIHGSIEDLRRLSSVVREVLNRAKPSDRIVIDKEYSNMNKFGIVLEVREDGFDPAREDRELWD
jgi:hypothetical protein